jgi:hypothetical protein
LFLRPKFGPWQHCSCVWIKIAASFPSPDDEKITKGLAHCEERPAPYVIADEKCAIFSNSEKFTNVLEYNATQEANKAKILQAEPTDLQTIRENHSVV